MGLIKSFHTKKSSLWHSTTDKNEAIQIKDNLKKQGAKTKITKDKYNVYGLWVNKEFYNTHNNDKK